MIARKSTLIIIANIIEAVTAYIALWYITRYMAPGDYGVIGFAMGFVGLFSIIANLGYTNAHVKYISEGKDKGVCNGTFFSIKLVLMGLMSLATITAVFFWKAILQRGFETPAHEIAIFIILVYYVLENLANMFLTTFTGEIKIAKSEIPKFVATIARTIAIIYVAILGLGPINLAYAYVFGHLFMFILSAWLFRNYSIKRPTKECFKDYTRFAWPLVLVSCASLLISNLDKVLIQLFWSSDEVGYYFASQRISGFIVLFAVSLGLILFPTFSAYFSKKDSESVRNIFRLSERYISLFTFPAVIGLAVLAEPTIHILLSDKYISAVPIFRVLPFYALLYAFTIPFESVFLGMNKPKLVRNRMLMMLVCNVVLCIVFIPKDIHILGLKLFGWGAAGAGLATVISYAIGLFFYSVSAKKQFNIQLSFKILLHLFAATIMGLILYWISASGIILLDRWFELIGVSVLGIGIYVGILWVIREFTKKDLYFILDILSIRKMWTYIVKEMKEK